MSKSFIIKRSEWIRGLGAEGSRLLTPDGRKCCLGFYSLACGYTEEDIFEKDTPAQNLHSYILKNGKYPDNFSEWSNWVITEKSSARNSETNSDDICALMEVNDTKKGSESEREAKIKEIFARNNIEVIFED